jgi:KDO2-lipid IV(A) lauroyltransferase
MVRIKPPSWHDFATGGDARRRWLVYWLWNMPLDGLQWLLFQIFSFLPITFVSSLGGRLARVIAPQFFSDAMARAVANLRWLEPAWSEARIREVASRHFESVGRLRAEFPVLHRLMRSGRISVENGELAKTTMMAGPVILVGTHIGNWEILGPVMAQFGIPAFDIFEPQPSGMQTRLALKVRAKIGPEGSVAYARNANAPRVAVKWLKEGGTLVMFCDEAVHGISAAPFFGRPPHFDSNYAFAARLARLTDATLLPFHVLRHPGCRFTVRFGSPIRLTPTDRPSDCLLEDVVLLNGVVEPVVRANLDQWFWLNWGFAGVNYSTHNP